MTETKFEIEIFVLIILNHHLSQNFKIIRKNEFKYRLINIYIYIYIWGGFAGFFFSWLIR
jgi:hypothetical protein